MTVAELKRKRQDEFVETRTIIEREVNMFFNSIANMDPDVQQKCNYNPDYNARTVLPALWVEPFNEEEYNKQLTNLTNYYAGVKQVCDQIDEEARKCLQS